MASDHLNICAHPKLDQAKMVLGFSGWMDGGGVSTGTVGWLVSAVNAQRLAEIEPVPFYIYNFPGPMELSSLFRPHTKIENGLITYLEYPSNVFFCDPKNNLILFSGKEPNFRWDEYAECIFSLAGMFDVKRIYFVGSVAGVVPHTRQPRLLCSVSDEAARNELEQHGVRFSDYQGPASLVTYLTYLSSRRGIQMASLVAEIPAYVQGTNPICIESVIRRLTRILGLQVEMDELRSASEKFEARLNEAVQKQSEMAQIVQKMEADYDNEVFDTQLGDLKEWLEQKGIRLE